MTSRSSDRREMRSECQGIEKIANIRLGLGYLAEKRRQSRKPNEEDEKIQLLDARPSETR